MGMARFGRSALAAMAMMALGGAAAAQPAGSLPTTVGECVETTIERIGGRLEGDPGFESGMGLLYANGGRQVSYERDPGVKHSQPGDPVRMCLVSIPQGCPPGDDRGRVYVTTNLRTGGSWEMPDSQHMCGGA